MENKSPICMQTVINNVTSHLSGNNCKNTSVVKLNNDDLAINGELYFLLSLKAWENLFEETDKCVGGCKTILQHFHHIHNCETRNKTDVDIANQVLQLLTSASNKWPIKIEKYLLKRERVYLFLQHTPLIGYVIKAAISLNRDFGRTILVDKTFSLKALNDKESELTSERIRLIQSVTERILSLHGCEISDEHPDFKFVLTSKSQGNVQEDYEKYICGVVKNKGTNSKETKLTWKEYLESKIRELEALNEHKLCNGETKDYFLGKLAKAIIVFELLSIKPSRSVFIGCNFPTDKSTTNTKGASFVLYNVARITAIIDKYNDQRLNGEYPNLPDINCIDFSLLTREDEWELIYNFIIGFQEMLKNCLKFEPVFQINPQIICVFLSQLCQKFSIYYHRTRILTKAYDHLIPTMFARLYMLHALRIVLQNALALIDIVPLSRM